MTEPQDGRSVFPEVQYKFHFNVIDLGAAVTDVLERAILHHMRPENPKVEGYYQVSDAKLYPYPLNSTFQVDPAKIAHVLEHLIHSFRFNHSYSLVLMNPKKHLAQREGEAGGVYGYRTGYSDGEIDLLRKDHTLFAKKPKFEADREPRYFESDFSPIDEGSLDEQSQERYVHEQADLFSPMQWKMYVDKAEKWSTEYLAKWKQRPLHASEYPDSIKQLHFSGVEGLETLLQQVLHKGSPHDYDHLHEVQSNRHLHEECLVDAWVSHTRTAFVDLSAGPASWGPVVSGEGVKTGATFPSVARLFADIARGEQAHTEAKQTVLETREDRYEQLLGEREILLEDFERSCWDRETDTMRMSDACSIMLNDIDARDQALDRIRQGETHLLGSILGDEEAAVSVSRLATDAFLARVGATISTTLRHLVTPSTRKFPEYSERVAFHVYVVSNHHEYKPLANFHYHDFQREVQKLRLPHQSFKFTLHHISMAEDVALAMAFETSLRSAAVPTLKVSGTFSAAKRMYLDSATLKAQLLRLQDHLGGDPSRADTLPVRHIPIFLFSVHYSLPLFIDKFFQARSLGDMVLVVQSEMQDWESPLQCNGRPLFVNLRSPLRAALQATMQELGGLVPAHETFSEAHNRTISNWMWSVGETPLSATSSRYNVSLFQRDAIHRSYLVTALQRAHARTTHAVARLTALETTIDNFAAVSELPFKDTREQYWKIEDATREMLALAGGLDFAAATKEIQNLNNAVSKFVAYVDRCEAAMVQHRCPRPAPSAFPVTVFYIAAALALGTGIFMAFRSKSRKVKIN